MRNKVSKYFNKIISSKTVKWIVIPCVLVLLWISLSLFYSSYRSFTVLQYAHSQDKDNHSRGGKLLKGKRLTGVFEARENYLGIVAVRFGDVSKLDFDKEDLILFKIKERGQDNWLYQNMYRSGSFTSGQYFPFGFAEIKNSKGKRYEFEITSLRGNVDNSLETKLVNPIYLTKYKFPKDIAFKNLSSTISFMSKKLITFFTNIDSLLSSTVFILPLVFYYVWILLPMKVIKNTYKTDGKKIFGVLVVILLLSDVVLYDFINTGLMLGLLGLWCLCVYLNKLRSSLTFALAFLLICISMFSIYFGLGVSVDKASAFAYLFFLTGLFQIVGEYRHDKKLFTSK